MDQLPIEMSLKIIAYLGFHNITAFTLITMDTYQIFNDVFCTYICDSIKTHTMLDIGGYKLQQLVHLSKVLNNRNQICCGPQWSLILNRTSNELYHMGSQKIPATNNEVIFNERSIRFTNVGNIIEIAESFAASILLDNQKSLYILANHDVKWLKEMRGNKNINDINNNTDILDVVIRFSNNLDIIKIRNSPNGCLILTRDGEVYLVVSGLKLIANRTHTIDMQSCLYYVFLVSSEGHLYISQDSNEGRKVIKIDTAQDVISIACGTNHLLALDKYGNVYYFEVNLKTGQSTKDLTPVQILGITGIIQIVTNDNSALLLTNRGHVYKLDLLTQPRFNIEIIADLRDIVQIATSINHYLALTSTEMVYGFGSNQDFKLGLPDMNVIYPPTLVFTNIKVV